MTYFIINILSFPHNIGFVSVIASEDVELACDVLQWSYVQALEDGYYGVCMDLSVGSYLNHALTMYE